MDRHRGPRAPEHSAPAATPSAQVKSSMIPAPTIGSRTRRIAGAFAIGLSVLLATAVTTPAFARSTPEALPEVSLADLPKEAQDLRAQIGKGGPFRYSRDGVVFGNRERLLPMKPR